MYTYSSSLELCYTSLESAVNEKALEMDFRKMSKYCLCENVLARYSQGTGHYVNLQSFQV